MFCRLRSVQIGIAIMCDMATAAAAFSCCCLQLLLLLLLPSPAAAVAFNVALNASSCLTLCQ